MLFKFHHCVPVFLETAGGIGGTARESTLKKNVCYEPENPIPVAAWSKAWVCGRSHAGIEGSIPGGGKDPLSLLSVVCCQVEVSASG